MCEAIDHFKEWVGLNASKRTSVPTHEGADNEHDEIKKLSVFMTSQSTFTVKIRGKYRSNDFISTWNNIPKSISYISDDDINIYNNDFENTVTKVTESRR